MLLRHPTLAETLNIARGYGRDSEAPHLWNGLIGAWAPVLGPTGSTLRDVSGYGNDGTITGATWASGQYGYALNWALANEKIVLDSDVVCGSGDAMTIALWMNPTNLSAFRGVFGDDQGLNGSRVFISATTVYWYSDQGAAETWAKAISTGTWHQFVLTQKYDGTWWHTECFVDATSLGTQSTAKASDSFVLKRIGHWGSDTYEWSGLLSNTIVWDRVLAASEIQQLYADPFALLRPRRRVWGTTAAPPSAKPWWYYDMIGSGVGA